MANETIDPLARRAGEVEAEIKKLHGDDVYAATIKALEKKIADGGMSRDDLVRKLGQENAASAVFNAAAGDMDEATWRKFRDNLPDRKRCGTERAAGDGY